MDYDINDYIEQFRKKKREIDFIERIIENRRKIFEKLIRPLINSLQIRKKELSLLTELELSVRLGDLLEELAFLACIQVSDIYVEVETGISFYGKYNLLEILQLINDPIDNRCRTKNNEIKLDLFGCNKDYLVTLEPVFEYFTSLPLDLDSIQADGSQLIQHCNVKYCSDDDGRIYTKLIINNDIEDVICNFNLRHIIKENNDDWYPTELFHRAIINCIQKNCHSNKVKKRERLM